MSGPLNGKVILLTRENGPSTVMARDIRALDGTPVILPLMKIVPCDLTQEEMATIRKAQDFDWVVFTSPNGVRAFMSHVKLLNMELTQLKFAAVGKKTAQEIRSSGWGVEFVPAEFTAESLAKLFIENENKGTKVLLPLGNLAKPILEELLQNAGFVTKRVNVYKTIMNDVVQNDLIQLVKEQHVDVITFASPSAIEFFLSMTKDMDLSDFWDQTIVACIGKVSANYARAQGIHPRIIPETYTAQSLVEAIAEFYSAT